MSSALVFGTGIHTAIEDFYRAELAGEEKPDVEQLMFAYQSAWLPHDPEAIASVKANVTAIGPHPARPAPAVAPRDPPHSADACRSAIGRTIRSTALRLPTRSN